MLKSKGYYGGEFHFSLERENRVQEIDSSIIRTGAGEIKKLKLAFKAPFSGYAVLLHTDMFDGTWNFYEFENETSGGDSDVSYILKTDGTRCGLSSFKFAVKTHDGILWEPSEYHEILIDPDSLENTFLYTLIPNVTGHIKNWTKQIKKIKKMGFNAVHILPFTEMGSSESPYSASNLFAVDASAGNDGDYPAFVATARLEEVRICLDIVLNHISNENRLCSEKSEWIVPDKSRDDGMKRAGCYHKDDWISWEDLVLLNYDHPDPEIRMELYEYMLCYVLYWVKLSGGNDVILRLDNLHSSNSRFIKWLIPEIRKVYNDIIILSEYFGAEYHLEESVREYGLNLLTANSWEYPFVPVLQRYLEGIHRNGTLRYIISPTSHDTEAAAKLFGTAESSVPRYAVCALMGTGICGMVQGFEYGLPEKINFIGRNAEKNIEELSSETEYDFSDFIRRVNLLAQSEKCLRQRGNIEFYDTGNDSIILCRRKSCGGGGILIAANLDIYNSHEINYNTVGDADIVLVEKAEAEIVKQESVVRIKLGACGVCAVRIE